MTILPLLLNKYLCLLLAFVTGAIGTLAFSPYDLWPIAIISLSGLLVTTINHSSCQAGWLGFVWGCGLFSTGINWIYISIAQFSGLPSIVNILLIIMLIFYLALYPMLFSYLLVKFWSHTSFYQLVLGAPMLWLIVEFLRGLLLSGFPWLEFGYSQIDGSLKGIAPILGVKAITFILMKISGLVVFSILKKKWLPFLISLALFLLPWPLQWLKWYKYQPKQVINVTLVQGNIPQESKWNYDQINEILDIYLNQTLPALGKSQIIIWPESAIPDEEKDQKKFLSQLDEKLRKRQTYLITGIMDRRLTSRGYSYYNSILVLGETVPYHYPSSTNRYDKHHLVPFGETIPFERFLRPLAPLFNLPMSSLSKGKYIQPQLKVAGMKLTAAICYEIILGSQVRDNFRSDTDFLLTISNDAWFGNSLGPWQHFQMARMRSLELGRPLLRSTNNGITAVIDADGSLLAQLPQFTRDSLNINVSPTKGVTPYAHTGSWPLWLIAFLTGLTSFLLDRQILN